MTKLIYVCTTPTGVRTETTSLAQAKSITAKGGAYNPKYVKVIRELKFDAVMPNGQKMEKVSITQALNAQRQGGSYRSYYIDRLA